MAFFDDIGKKISQAGQTTVQKTKDVVDVARLNSAISDEEKKLNEAYIILGKLYIAKHAEDAEEDFAATIAAVKESEGKIADYKHQIKDIKGVSICEKCGGEIPLGNAFCGNCGAPATAAADSDKVRCVRCGTLVDRSMRFCTRCGNTMPVAASPTESGAPTVEAQPEPIPAAAPAVPLAPEEEAPVGARCVNCGAVLAADAAFCTECGTPIAAQATPNKVCANCGNPLLDDAAFCVECGTPVAEAQPTKVCLNCGSTLLDGALFCTECGSKL